MIELSAAEQAALKLARKTVKDRMDPDGVEVHPADTPIAKARKRFARQKASLIVVQRGEELIGLLAPHHLSKEPGPDEDERTIASLDLAPLETLAPGASVVDALETMLCSGLRVMPVRKKHHANAIAGVLQRRTLDKVERALWRNADSRLLLETGQDHNKRQLAGPPVPGGEAVRDPSNRRCDLLLYVPDDRIGRFIDAASGGYGYSHMAIDVGELHRPTGAPLIIEGTTAGVRRNFLAVHGNRPCARVSLLPHGVDPDQFAACLYGKIGERYDYREIFSAGWMDSPVKQICSDLVTVCLPDALCAAIIARAHAKGLRTHALAARRRTHDFISPNAYAEYFGAPPGEELQRSRETEVQPQSAPTGLQA